MNNLQISDQTMIGFDVYDFPDLARDIGPGLMLTTTTDQIGAGLGANKQRNYAY